MGGREGGGLSHILPGYRSITNKQHRAEVAEFWGVPPQQLESTPGLTAVEMFEAAARGELKALWVMCSNPLVSMPNLNLVSKAI